MAIKVYNTLTKTKEEFFPREPGRVSIYTCGVTPYDYAHIGNARPAVFWDCVRRFLSFRGYQVNFITNFTDVDDKIINRAKQLGKEPLQLAEHFAEIYLADLKTLGVLPADGYPKVSEHIPEIIKMIEVLIEKGFAYVLDNGDVYYAVNNFTDYGKLSGRSLEDLKAGARVEINEAKADPMDFALWKAAKPGEINWDSPWGPGRPGWHIECSAMSIKYLGAGFDFHGGGEDLVFPHHENEIAQSEAYLGKPFVNYWLHNAFITVGGERMGKSVGNFSTIHDVLAKFSPQTVRFWLIGTHYRNPISFGEEEMIAAANGFERLANACFNWEHLLKQNETGATISEDAAAVKAKILKTKEDFIKAMEDDFNTPQALASLYDLVRDINRWIQDSNFQLNQTTKTILENALETLKSLGGILGLFGIGEVKAEAQISAAEIEALITQRTQAKKDKNWALADQIRNDLKSKGVIIEDTAQGVRWKLE